MRAHTVSDTMQSRGLNSIRLREGSEHLSGTLAATRQNLSGNLYFVLRCNAIMTAMGFIELPLLRHTN